MTLKVYVDRISEPSRAIVIFCKANGIDFEEVRIDLFKGEHKTPEFKEINPMGLVPAIDDGRVKLFESHAILSYLASAFPGVPDHWYPADIIKRAKINSILDWHHTNLRLGGITLVRNLMIAPLEGKPVNTAKVEEGEKLVRLSLSTIESVWLQGDSKFLLGHEKPSIADLSLACEVTQFELLDDKVRLGIMEPYKKISQWVENVRAATSPHFEEVHQIFYIIKEFLGTKR